MTEAWTEQLLRQSDQRVRRASQLACEGRAGTSVGANAIKVLASLKTH